MLYTIFSKALLHHNKTIQKNAETIEKKKISQTGNNILTAYNHIIRHKYGRKSMLQQTKQINQKIRNSPFLVKNLKKSPTKQVKDEKLKERLTICWTNKYKNEKKRAHSNQYCPQVTGEQTKYELFSGQASRRKQFKNITLGQQSNNQSTIKQNMIEKRSFKDNRGVFVDLYGKQGYKRQQRTNIRIIAKHNRFASIDISHNPYPKVSLVELINRFQFENLKTTHQKTSSSKNSIKLEKKQADHFQKTLTQKKFFCENQQKNLIGYERKRIKTASKKFRKYEYVDETSQNTERKTNSIFSPWAIDNEILSQPLDIQN